MAADKSQRHLPETMLAWPLYGAGIENLGENGHPIRWPVPQPSPSEILVRSDAVGLCYSDVKVIRLGGDHPRLYGRNLKSSPIVQGHELALTVVQVGEAWRDRFRPGQRLAMQADVYYGGRNLSVGYMFYGGLAQYVLLGPEILAGDEGCYAIPVGDELGYAEVALTEPWACVEAAYVPRRRVCLEPGGVLWIVGRPGLTTPYRLGDTFSCDYSRKVVLTDVPDSLLPDLPVPEIVVRNALSPEQYAALAQAETSAGFDDVIVLEPTAEVLDGISRVSKNGGTITLVGERPLERPVKVDVGRVHYDYVAYLGARGHDIAAAFGEARNRSELRAGGVAWVVGGGGPMGRMHVQRMIEMPHGPRRIVVAETNILRGGELVASFAEMARSRGKELGVLNPNRMSPEEFDSALHAAHGGRGFDDIVVIVANVPAIEASAPYLAPDGMLVIFGGLARGTMADLDLSNVYLGNAQLTGSAGSTIRDQAAVIANVAAGHLSTASAVAAIGGMDAAKDGIQGLMDRRFPGKMVIFPQVASFPLTALPDLKQAAPSVFAKLAPDGTWTREAEMEFLHLYAGDTYS
jgi:threonine dehydrogenase-like Zn-dependent dehydrogenase